MIFSPRKATSTKTCSPIPTGWVSERGLVIYHNKYAETRGWVKTSAAFMDKAGGKLVQKTLAEGLALPQDGYAIFKDYVTHLEYIRPCRELVEKGMYVELGGYHCHVFMDWRFVDSAEWGKVCDALNGAGVPSLQAKYDEMFAVKPEEVVLPKKAVRKTAAKKIPAKSPVKPAPKKKRVSQEIRFIFQNRKTSEETNVLRKSYFFQLGGKWLRILLD